MALVRCDFFSDVLELSTSMTVLLPQATSGQIGLAGRATSGEFPVLYLLHGLSDDATTWVRRTALERYVAPLGLAVVMPQVNRSFYADEVHGNRYWTFVADELPEIVASFFRVSPRREDTFVAGLSMGGYGALKLALRHPERYAAAASLSGALDVARMERSREWRPDLIEQVFGAGPITDTPEDTGWLLAQADPVALPALYVCCGTEDELIDGNRSFVAAAAARGVDMTSDFGPGEHEWGYWDRTIQDVLSWLPLHEQRPGLPGG